MKQHTVGIDISKAHLDAHRLADGLLLVQPAACRVADRSGSELLLECVSRPSHAASGR